MKPKPEVRYDNLGPIRLMARAEGYVMARRRRCYPFIIHEDDWHLLSETIKGKDHCAYVVRQIDTKDPKG